MNGLTSLDQRSAVYLMPLQDDNILLLERQNTGYMDGRYSFVAGHVEPGESVTDAMIREAREEAGMTVRLENLQFSHVCHRRSSDFLYYDFFFRTEQWMGEIVNLEPEKCSDLSWFPLCSLPENTIPYIRTVIELVFQQNQSFSEYNW